MKARLTNNSFPKVSLLKQYNKKTQSDFKHLKISDKSVKLSLTKKELVVLDGEVLISVANCVKDKEIDKAKLIQLTRNACKFSNSISICGWNGLMIPLNIQYGSKKCQDLVIELKEFIIKHGNAFLEETERPGFLKIIKASESILKQTYDTLIVRHPKEETSSYFGMWALLDGTYYVQDDFYQALLDYGYTKEQIKVVIHSCTITGNNSLIPFYLRKKYLINPDGTNEVKRILLGE